MFQMVHAENGDMIKWLTGKLTRTCSSGKELTCN